MILASQSPRRVELMQEAGYTFRAIPAAIDETPLPGETPLDLVGRLARLKALAVAENHAAPGEVVLAADTIVAVDGRLLGKPADEREACAMLQRLSGRTHQVATGVCVALGPRKSGDAPAVADAFVQVTDVTFYPLSDEEIAAYAASGEPLDKAGAYGIQGAGGRLLVEKINGDYYNVVGLPIARTVRSLRALGCTR